ncbi:MAG: polysaccharide biosynthesis/export family protein [Pseudotabrizicola sp.]|uniref:polysaccharide biosynthesis/export family protein n=1 Tax=Pseudotabrizicola sp. TaxID=2939647 RepID=UPI00271633C4|nr:polysaccharide biosynthesis/export family protein [Pseudotabrizicola sp.]MDO9638018.1 polysaccharide biosynthesis/export family protein [Pseudotabrizicola sp.]
MGKQKTLTGPVFRLAAALLVLSVLAGCSAPRGAALQSEVLRGQNSANAEFQVIEVTRDSVSQVAHWPTTGWAGSYHWLPNGSGANSPLIAAGDRISLVIWDPQSNSLIAAAGERSVALPNLTVSPEGSLFVPYVGDIMVRGKTPSQVRQEIETALAPTVPSAQVQLTVEVGRLNSVDIVTGVGRAGAYPLMDRNTTILSLIAQAGGISSTLRNPLVRMIRDGRTYEIRAESLFSDGSKNVLMKGGDKVFVEEDRRYFTAIGAAGREELLYFERDNISAMEALSHIGGLVDSRADPKGILILRNYAAKDLRTDGSGPGKTQVVFTIDLTSAAGLFAARSFEINPKDTILVTESPIVAATSIMGLFGAAFGLRNAASD